MVPDDTNSVVHLADTTFYMTGNMIWILGWVHNKKTSF